VVAQYDHFILGGTIFKVLEISKQINYTKKEYMYLAGSPGMVAMTFHISDTKKFIFRFR